MERSKYFNYTRPSQTQLDYTEDSKARGILRRARSNFQFGTRTGFRITINAANNTQIDIGAGDGFTGGFYKSENLRGSPNSGERISTLTDAATGQVGYTKTVEGLGLVDYSANTKNYVCLKYAESEGIPLAERYYPFTTHNTIVSETYTSEVYTEAQWNALTTAELEQRVLVGIVTALGAGNPLSLANIQQMIQPKSHSVAGTQPSNITGVSITGVANETLIGNGTLRFEAVTKKLYWTAPGDAEGSGTIITSSGIYTLYSNDTSYFIFAEIIFAGLPAADLSDTISIESLYGRAIPMACAVDQVHRDMLGTGYISPTNPHGTSLDDITGGTFDHGDLFHVNGISGDAVANQLLCSINGPNDSVEIVNNGGFRNTFMVDGLTYEVLTGYSIETPGELFFDIIPKPDSGDYLIYVDSSGEPQYVKIAEYAPGGAADFVVLWDANIQIIDMHNAVAGNGTIGWTNLSGELTYESPSDAALGAGPGDPVRVLEGTGFGVGAHYGYYKLYSNNGTDWVIVFVDGNLGANNNSVFDIDKTETSEPDETILKLGVVTWNAIGDELANIRDIRRFNTADNREEVEEEHDSDGRHTKVMQFPLRVAIASSIAFHARASEDTGGFGQAFGDVGLCGSAQDNTGVRGIAGNDYGGHFTAANSYGAFGIALSYGVYGSAADRYGVYGRADNIGVIGSADVNRGVVGWAQNYGGSFQVVVNTGVYGSAAGVIGGYFVASDTGVRAIAINDVGLHAVAGGGIVAGDTAIFGSAHRFGADKGNFGGDFYADYDYGVRASAGNSFGVSATADVNYGGAFRCNGNAATGLQGWAGGGGGGEIGVYGTAPGAAAVGATGVAGAAGNVGTGVWGSGGTVGCYGICNIADGTGVFGTNPGAAGIGVYGYGGNNIGVMGFGANQGVIGWGNIANGIGVQGYNPHAQGTGGKFYAGSVGLYASVPVNGGTMTALHLDDGYLRYDIALDPTLYAADDFVPFIDIAGNTRWLRTYT